LSPRLYDAVTATYARTDATNAHPSRTDAPIPSANRSAATARARRSEIAPVAIGRMRLASCRRSSSTSATSFTRYPALATAQKIRNAAPVRSRASGPNRIPAAPGAAKTRRFFGHCRGRSARMSAATVVHEEAFLVRAAEVVTGRDGANPSSTGPPCAGRGSRVNAFAPLSGRVPAQDGKDAPSTGSFAGS
jgi:hypothetical protein